MIKANNKKDAISDDDMDEEQNMNEFQVDDAVSSQQNNSI